MKHIVQKIKVDVTLQNGDSFFGYMFLRDGERLQDVLNDKRSFVPIEKQQRKSSIKEDVYKMTIIHKEFIGSIEEIDE